MSIVQGGSGFSTLHPAAYHYLTTGEYLGQVVDDGSVPDPQIQQLLHQVKVSKLVLLDSHHLKFIVWRMVSPLQCTIVANYPGMARTVPEFTPMSRIAKFSRNIPESSSIT